MTPEGKVKVIAKKFLQKHNIPYWSVIPSPMGGVGMADLCCILPKTGQWLCLELKAAGKKKNVTANQQKFIDTVNTCNGIAVVVDCQEDLDLLEANLKQRGLI
jgi:hypothetical protein